MEVPLDHFSGHCLWSGRDQSFQNVTSKNDPVWNAANPFRFLSTVSTQGILFFKSKVQNSVAEGFIALAPGSPPASPLPGPHSVSKSPAWVPKAGPGCALGCSCRDGLTRGAPSKAATICSAGGLPRTQGSRGRAAAYLGPKRARSRLSLPLSSPQRSRLCPGAAAAI